MTPSLWGQATFLDFFHSRIRFGRSCSGSKANRRICWLALAADFKFSFSAIHLWVTTVSFQIAQPTAAPVQSPRIAFPNSGTGFPKN